MRCTLRYADALEGAYDYVKDDQDLIPRIRYELVEEVLGLYPEINPAHALGIVRGLKPEDILAGVDYARTGTLSFAQLSDSENWRGAFRFQPSGVRPYYLEFGDGGLVTLGGVTGAHGAVLKVTRRDEAGGVAVMARAWPGFADAVTLARRLEVVLFDGMGEHELAWVGINSVLLPREP